MKPAYLKSKQVPPGSTIQFVGIRNHANLTESLKCEYEWLNTVRLTDQDLSSNNILWLSQSFSSVGCWKIDIPVPWKEDFDVVELGLW
jgi:hypothetical protein